MRSSAEIFILIDSAFENVIKPVEVLVNLFAMTLDNCYITLSHNQTNGT